MAIEWEVVGRYPTGDEMVTTEMSKREALLRKAEYVENEKGVYFYVRPHLD